MGSHRVGQDWSDLAAAYIFFSDTTLPKCMLLLQLLSRFSRVLNVYICINQIHIYIYIYNVYICINQIHISDIYISDIYIHIYVYICINQIYIYIYMYLILMLNIPFQTISFQKFLNFPCWNRYFSFTILVLQLSLNLQIT